MQGKDFADNLLNANYTNTVLSKKNLNNNKKATSKISANFPIIWENWEDLNTIFKWFGIVFSVILGYTVKFVRKMLDLDLFSDSVKPSAESDWIKHRIHWLNQSNSFSQWIISDYSQMAIIIIDFKWVEHLYCVMCTFGIQFYWNS